jgi:hypothetical protein
MNSLLRADALEYLWRQFPNHCIVLTDPGTRKFIELGVDRAARHGFHSARDLHSYLTLMVFLGSYFDDDPQLPWAAPLLAQGMPMDRIFDAAVNAVEPVIGPYGEHYRRALIWVRAQPYTSLEVNYGGDAGASLERWLSDMYVRKFQSLPRPVVAELLHSIEARANRHGIGTRAGLLTLAALMFLLGHAVERDPLYPWAGAVLADTTLPQEAKAAALHREALRQLNRFMVLDRYVRED